jgi:hypothetical protein
MRDNEKIIQIHADFIGHLRLTMIRLIEAEAPAELLRSWVDSYGAISCASSALGEQMPFDNSRAMGIAIAHHGRPGELMELRSDQPIEMLARQVVEMMQRIEGNREQRPSRDSDRPQEGAGDRAAD